MDDWLGRRVGRSIRRLTTWFASRATSSPTGHRTPDRIVPRITTLEPRIVLNATAELSAAAGLLVFGDGADDLVRIETLPGGDSIQLTDANGAIISIDGHTGGATGSESDPLPVSQIGGSSITIDLGGGDDTLEIELPDGLDLNVIDGDGADRTDLSFQPTTSPTPPADITIDSETINLAPGAAFVPIADRNLDFRGNVNLGLTSPTGLTQFDLGTGTFQVDGTLTIHANISVTGGSGDVLWQNATISAASEPSSLFFDFDAMADSNIRLGPIDDSGGSLIDDVRIVSATDATLVSATTIDGTLSIDVLDQVSLDDDVAAASVDIRSDSITSFGDVRSQVGPVVLVATDQISVDGDIDVSPAGDDGGVTLSAANVFLSDASVVSAGGDLLVSGQTRIIGDVALDSAFGIGAMQAGDVTLIGPITSDGSMAGGQLSINAVVGASAGTIDIRGDVGGLSQGSVQDLRSFSATAGELSVRNIGVDGQGITLAGDQIHLFGSMLRSGDDASLGGGFIDLAGDVVFQQMNTSLIAVGGLVLDGVHRTLGPNDNVTLSSDDTVTIRGELAGGDQLSIQSTSTIQIEGDLLLWRDITIQTDDQINITGSISQPLQIVASESVIFESPIAFAADASIVSGDVRFDQSVTVADGSAVRIDAVMVDSIGQTEMIKSGNGELILLGANTSGTDLSVQAGTLRIDGSVDAAASIEVQSGAVLSGSGEVFGTVRVDGSLAPDNFVESSETGQLRIGSLTFGTTATYQVDVDGSVPGQTMDSIAVAGQPIDLSGARLQLDISATLPGDTELVVLRNDSAGPIGGRFFSDVDEDGNPLATPRELAEGDLVLRRFGPGALARPAYITYFGGDGNDVTIVTAGDRIQTVDKVTIVSRSGVDLQIRSGDSFSDAQAAVPTIRPIAGLNGGMLTIDAMVAQSELFVDIDGFVDTGPNPLHFDADIFFNAAAGTGDASVTLLDSDRISVDSPQQFEVLHDSAQTVRLTFQHAASVAPTYSVLMDAVSQIDLALPSLELSSQLSTSDDQFTMTSDANPAISVYDLVNNGQSSRFRYEHPLETLRIDGRGGDDTIVVDGFGQDFSAVPTVIGGDGYDQLLWNANVDVGSATVTHDLLFEADAVTVSGDIRLHGGGDLRVIAVDTLTIESVIDATGGQIRVESAAIQSDLSSSRLVSTNTDSAITLSGGDYLLGDIVATSGTVTLGSLDGSGVLELASVGSVQQAGGTMIHTDTLRASSGGFLDLNSTLNQIDEIDLVSAGSVTAFDSLDDLTVSVSAGDSIEIQVAGDLVLRSAETSLGTVELTSAGSLVAAAGPDNAHAGGDDVQLAAGVVFPGQSSMPGSIAEIGSATMPIRVSALQQFSASTSGTNGSIYVSSPGGFSVPSPSGALPIGRVDAGGGRIQIDAVTIDDDAAIDDIDLVGAEISIRTVSGIGESHPLRVSGVADLQATADTGSIRLDVQADRTVELSHLMTGGGDDTEIRVQHFGNDRLSVIEVANADGDVSILAETASIDVLPPTTGDSLSAGGDGQLRLQNLSGVSDITIRGGVSSDSGDVIIAARRNLVVTPAGSIDSLDGHVNLSGGNAAGQTASAIVMQDGSLVEAGSGTISLATPGDVYVSSLRSANPAQAITIDSESGSVFDAGDQHVDLVAESGLVTIDVAAGIGSLDPIETEIGRLIATVRQSGSLEIDEASSIELVDVVTADGKIDIVAAGTVRVDQLWSQNSSRQDGPLNRDVRLVASGPASDILVGSLIGGDPLGETNVTDVELIADDDVLSIDSQSLLVADDLHVISANATGDSAQSIRLRTDVNDLEFAVMGTARGDAQIDEQDSINLASSDRSDDGEVISTSNGEIRVSATNSIRITDVMLIDDQESLRDDVEVIAGGDHGRVHFQAGDSIRLGDSVQIQARQIAAGTVLIESPEVVLGDNLQIETGDGVGIARVFAPRPGEQLAQTAFYDGTTISTNRLEQAAINDATGVLTVEIGNPGERGLTINIDWGAATARFQQIDLLSGDAPPLQVEHLYLEGDILDARFNGRTSSTDPLEVRFSVRHHESIQVVGTTIEQSSSGIEVVEGELISSTDNPLTLENPATPILENGTARFIIPSLSIPVAFFPVRNVIPVIEQEPLIVSADQSFVVLGGGLETSETVASTTATREEYFQIRVLSPDPDGDDLAPPARLPDDIISGDKLKTLFQSLPDGRYDIQYILGDGNVRSILVVDLREGKPILLGGEGDGGTMRLIPVQDDADFELPQPSDDTGEPANNDTGVRPADGDTSEFIPLRGRSDAATEPIVHSQSTSDRESRLSVSGRFRSRFARIDSIAAGREAKH